MPAANIHLTLVFLGDVPTDRIQDLCASAETVTARGFELAIDSIKYWRHNRIVWAGPSVCPDALQALVAGLENALRVSGFSFDERPYMPHITLLRNARRAPAAQVVDAVSWRITDFALVQSVRRDNGTAYEPLRHWPLGAGDTGGPGG